MCIYNKIKNCIWEFANGIAKSTNDSKIYGNNDLILLTIGKKETQATLRFHLTSFRMTLVYL